MADRITLANFTLRYSASAPTALSSVSLDVPAGSCCAMVGPTGAGKTSLLHCIAGTLGKHHPEALASGRLQIGERTFDTLPDQILFPAVGLVLQDPSVQISGVRDTVYEEILLTLENMGPLPGNPSGLIIPLLQALGIEHLADRKPTTLSGGETQRVALATILIAQPHTLLLDEPTTSLDTRAQEKLQSILRALSNKTTVLLSDTQLDFVLGVADQIAILDHGRILFYGEPLSLLESIGEFSSILPVDIWRQLKLDRATLLQEASLRHAPLAKGL